jgi:hypothetical protein
LPDPLFSSLQPKIKAGKGAAWDRAYRLIFSFITDNGANETLAAIGAEYGQSKGEEFKPPEIDSFEGNQDDFDDVVRFLPTEDEPSFVERVDNYSKSSQCSGISEGAPNAEAVGDSGTFGAFMTQPPIKPLPRFGDNAKTGSFDSDSDPEPISITRREVSKKEEPLVQVDGSSDDEFTAVSSPSPVKSTQSPAPAPTKSPSPAPAPAPAPVDDDLFADDDDDGDFLPEDPAPAKPAPAPAKPTAAPVTPPPAAKDKDDGFDDFEDDEIEPPKSPAVARRDPEVVIDEGDSEEAFTFSPKPSKPAEPLELVDDFSDDVEVVTDPTPPAKKPAVAIASDDDEDDFIDVEVDTPEPPVGSKPGQVVTPNSSGGSVDDMAFEIETDDTPAPPPSKITAGDSENFDIDFDEDGDGDGSGFG